jgi:hypothetical protein
VIAALIVGAVVLVALLVIAATAWPRAGRGRGLVVADAHPARGSGVVTRALPA